MNIQSVCETLKGMIVDQAHRNNPEVQERYFDDPTEENLAALWSHPDWKVVVIRANVEGFQSGDVTVVKVSAEGLLAYSNRDKKNVILDRNVIVGYIASAGF